MQVPPSSSLEMSPNRQPWLYFFRVGIAQGRVRMLGTEAGKAHTPVETLRMVDRKMTVERIR